MIFSLRFIPKLLRKLQQKFPTKNFWWLTWEYLQKKSFTCFCKDSSENSFYKGFWDSGSFCYNSTNGSCNDLFWKFIKYLSKDFTKKSLRMCPRISLEIYSRDFPRKFSKSPTYFFFAKCIHLSVFGNSESTVHHGKMKRKVLK